MKNDERAPAVVLTDAEALAGRVTVVSWEEHERLCAIAVAREHHRMVARTADAAARLAAVETLDLDPYCPDHGDRPTTYDECSCASRAALLAARTREALTRVEALTVEWTTATCQTDGAPCSWHRVSAECAAELTATLSATAPDAGQREAQERATYQPGPHDRVSHDDDGTTYVDGLPWRINRDGIQAAATTQEGAEAMHARLVQRRADRSPEQP